MARRTIELEIELYNVKKFKKLLKKSRKQAEKLNNLLEQTVGLQENLFRIKERRR